MLLSASPPSSRPRRGVLFPSLQTERGGGVLFACRGEEGQCHCRKGVVSVLNRGEKSRGTISRAEHFPPGAPWCTGRAAPVFVSLRVRTLPCPLLLPPALPRRPLSALPAPFGELSESVAPGIRAATRSRESRGDARKAKSRASRLQTSHTAAFSSADLPPRFPRTRTPLEMKLTRCQGRPIQPGRVLGPHVRGGKRFIEPCV